MVTLEQIGQQARRGAIHLAAAPILEKNRALLAVADALEEQCALLLEANREDLAHAAENGVTQAMQDRLRLTEERVAEIAAAVREIAGMEDPVGRVLDGGSLPNGLQITRISVPLGVVAVIYESRPNVTVDIAALCLKSGNACILRGGKEAACSNTALVRVIREALEKAAVPADCVQLVEDTGRESAVRLMQLGDYVDLLIPRGGAGLIASVVENATVPVIETGSGNCHIYVDKSADMDMAVRIVDNAKTSRPSVCNAMETLLVHSSRAEEFLPLAASALSRSAVELRCCPRACEILGDRAAPATEADWETEYDDYILAVKVVDTLEEALEHIERYSTRHSESIVTADLKAAMTFTARVDSAAVYVNASTRFTDGGVFGLGAEIGISTQKLHARGPMGLVHLTSYKYIIQGDGQVR